MDALPLEALLAEITENRPAILFRLEGLRDYQRVNLKGEAMTEVQALIVDYERRDGLLVQLQSEITMARATVIALVNDGYPGLPVREVGDVALEDLSENRETINAAFGQFRRRDITTEGTSTVGPEEPVG